MSNTPSDDLMRTTFTKYGWTAGYWQLRHAGYTISREACRKYRMKLVEEGAAVSNVWNAAEAAKAIEMAAAGAQGVEIAAALGKTPNAIYDLFRRKGVKIASRAEAKAPSRDELMALYAEKSARDIATALGVTDKMVGKWLRLHKIPINKLRSLPPIVKPAPQPFNKRNGYRLADLPPPESGPAAEAARYLRRQGYANVYRRSQEEWWVGRGPMAERDMIARAAEIEARKGRMQA